MVSAKVDPNKVEELAAEFSRLSRTIEDGEVDINRSISALLREIYYQYSETYVRSSTSNASSLLGQIRKLASSIALRLKNKATVLDNAAEIYRKNEEDSSKTSKKSDVSSLFGKIGKTVGYFFKYAGKAATNVFSAILGFIFGKGKNSATEAAINLPLNISPLESYLTKNPKKKIEEVKILQQRLKDLGYDIKVDGYYGEETYKIVNLFKDTYGLINEGENKGVVDNQVWQYLFGGLSGELKYNPDEYSELVRIAQIRLKDLGYDVEATGYFDEKMLIAVNEYKEANKLGNTGDWEGVIGAQTWSVMFSAGAVAKIITPDIEEEIETLPPVNDNKVPDVVTGKAITEAPSNYTDNQKVQYYLTQMGFDIGGIDGIVGQYTQAAILVFQHSQGLPVTGKVDAATLAALEKCAKEGRTISDTSVYAPFSPKPTNLGDPGGASIQSCNRKEASSSDLISIGYYRVHKDAGLAWAYLITAARMDGIDEANGRRLLTIGSGFRSIEEQTILWEDALERYHTPEEARIWVAPPGTSEHQTGFAIDFTMRYTSSSSNVELLRDTPEYEWMVKNAHKYGFYNYQSEPWHWSYNPPR